MLINHTITEYYDRLDSLEPSPGGGSVAALVGTLGVGLIRMCMHLSFSKKKYNEANALDQELFSKRFEQLLVRKEQLMKIIDEDATSYQQVIEAMRLPQSTPLEITQREQAIQTSLVCATQVPLSVMELSVDVMQLAIECLPLANSMAISDLIYGLSLCASAAEGSYMNVVLNMKQMNEENKEYFKNKSQKYLNQSIELKEQILSKVTL